MFVAGCRLLLLAALCTAAGFSQDSKETATVRDNCVKLAAGKSSAEFEAFIKDYVVPMNQGRADSGEIAWFLLLRGVVPAGSSAPCDYRVVYGYKGMPPESPSTEQIDMALRRAKLNLTAKDLFARRDTLSQLVNVEFWYQIDSVGPGAQKGSYVRLNHYNVKPGMAEDWTRLETTYWKRMVQAWTEAGGKGAWFVYGLAMPSGDYLPYNAATVDVFADWNSLLRGVPFDLWPKVHPQTDSTELFNRLDRVRTRHSIEVYKVVEMTAPAKSGTTD